MHHSVGEYLIFSVIAASAAVSANILGYDLFFSHPLCVRKMEVVGKKR